MRIQKIRLKKTDQLLSLFAQKLSGKLGKKMDQLLNLFAQKLNCAYLSDLPWHYKNLSPDFLHNINPQEYSLQEWNETLTYLLHQESQCATAEEAYALLLNLIAPQ